MSSTTEARIRELTDPMWRKKFYAVLWDGNGADLRPYLVEHLEYMIGLERAGKLFASGPLDFGASSDGLTILRSKCGRGASARLARPVRGERHSKLSDPGMDGDGRLVRN